jgi:arylsulfatase A-like enzyme
MFILYDPGHPGGRADAHIMDIAPTLLRRVGVAVPGDMRGRILE